MLLLHGSHGAKAPIEIVARNKVHGVDLFPVGAHHHLLFGVLPVPAFGGKLHAIAGHILLLDRGIRPELIPDAMRVFRVLGNGMHLDAGVKGNGARTAVG